MVWFLLMLVPTAMANELARSSAEQCCHEDLAGPNYSFCYQTCDRHITSHVPGNSYDYFVLGDAIVDDDSNTGLFMSTHDSGIIQDCALGPVSGIVTEDPGPAPYGAAFFYSVYFGPAYVEDEFNDWSIDFGADATTPLLQSTIYARYRIESNTTRPNDVCVMAWDSDTSLGNLQVSYAETGLSAGVIQEVEWETSQDSRFIGFVWTYSSGTDTTDDIIVTLLDWSTTPLGSIPQEVVRNLPVGFGALAALSFMAAGVVVILWAFSSGKTRL